MGYTRKRGAKVPTQPVTPASRYDPLLEPDAASQYLSERYRHTTREQLRRYRRQGRGGPDYVVEGGPRGRGRPVYYRRSALDRWGRALEVVEIPGDLAGAPVR